MQPAWVTPETKQALEIYENLARARSKACTAELANKVLELINLPQVPKVLLNDIQEENANFRQTMVLLCDNIFTNTIPLFTLRQKLVLGYELTQSQENELTNILTSLDYGAKKGVYECYCVLGYDNLIIAEGYRNRNECEEFCDYIYKAFHCFTTAALAKVPLAYENYALFLLTGFTNHKDPHKSIPLNKQLGIEYLSYAADYKSSTYQNWRLYLALGIQHEHNIYREIKSPLAKKYCEIALSHNEYFYPVDPLQLNPKTDIHNPIYYLVEKNSNSVFIISLPFDQVTRVIKTVDTIRNQQNSYVLHNGDVDVSLSFKNVDINKEIKTIKARPRVKPIENKQGHISKQGNITKANEINSQELDDIEKYINGENQAKHNKPKNKKKKKGKVNQNIAEAVLNNQKQTVDDTEQSNNKKLTTVVESNNNALQTVSNDEINNRHDFGLEATNYNHFSDFEPVNKNQRKRLKRQRLAEEKRRLDENKSMTKEDVASLKIEKYISNAQVYVQNVILNQLICTGNSQDNDSHAASYNIDQDQTNGHKVENHKSSKEYEKLEEPALKPLEVVIQNVTYNGAKIYEETVTNVQKINEQKDNEIDKNLNMSEYQLKDHNKIMTNVPLLQFNADNNDHNRNNKTNLTSQRNVYTKRNHVIENPYDPSTNPKDYLMHCYQQQNRYLSQLLDEAKTYNDECENQMYNDKRFIQDQQNLIQSLQIQVEVLKNQKQSQHEFIVGQSKNTQDQHNKTVTQLQINLQEKDDEVADLKRQLNTFHNNDKMLIYKQVMGS